MPIRFLCLQCQVRMRVPDGAAGLRIRCPKCGVSQHVPAVSMDDDPSNATALGMPVTEHHAGGGVEQTHAPAAGDWPDDAATTTPDAGNDNPLAALAAIASGDTQHSHTDPAHVPGPAAHEQQRQSQQEEEDPAEALRKALEQPAEANHSASTPPAPPPNQARGAHPHAPAPALKTAAAAHAHPAPVRHSQPRVPQFAPPPAQQAGNQQWDDSPDQDGSEVDALSSALGHDPALSAAATHHADSTPAHADPRPVHSPPRQLPAQQQTHHQAAHEPSFQTAPLPPRAAPLPPASPALHRPVARPIPVGASQPGMAQPVMSVTHAMPMQATGIAIPYQPVPATPPPAYKAIKYTSILLMGFSGLAVIVTVIATTLTITRSSRLDLAGLLMNAITGLSISVITMGLALAIRALRDIAQNSYRR